MAVDEHLRIDVRRDDDMAVVRLAGELDLAVAQLFQDELDGVEVSGANTIVLDLRELEFIDSTGLRVIFSAHERARERGHRFAVTRGSAQVERLLSITRADEHVQIVDSPEELRG